MPRVLFTIMHASMHASKHASMVLTCAPTSPAKMLSFYWDEDGVQRRQDIGYNKFAALKGFLIDSRHEDCCYHSFDNKRWFYCKQDKLEDIFGIDSEYTTFFFIDQDHAFDEIRGNLACYTEEQLRNMDTPGTVLKMPNNLNQFLNQLRVLPQLEVLPETARQCFEFWIDFEIKTDDHIEWKTHCISAYIMTMIAALLSCIMTMVAQSVFLKTTAVITPSTIF